MNEDATEEGTTGIEGAARAAVGEQLRAGRIARNLSLEDIAQITRVSLRQLQSIEESDFDALPGRTYAFGFVRAYARAIDLDGQALVRQLEEDLDGARRAASADRMYEPVDPAHLPPRLMVWSVIGILVLLVLAYAVWRSTITSTDTVAALDESAGLTADGQAGAAGRPARPAPTPVAATPVAGPVVLVARDDVWLRVYEADAKPGEHLFEQTLAKGDKYEVPATARAPQILTGRPDALSVTVGGKPVPPLGEAERTIADFPIDAASLTARTASPPVSAVPPAR